MKKSFLDEMQEKEVNFNEGVFGDLIGAAGALVKGSIKHGLDNFKQYYNDAQLKGMLKEINKEITFTLKKQEDKIKKLMPTLEKDTEMLESFSNMTKAIQNFQELANKRIK